MRVESQMIKWPRAQRQDRLHMPIARPPPLHSLGEPLLRVRQLIAEWKETQL